MRHVSEFLAPLHGVVFLLSVSLVLSGSTHYHSAAMCEIQAQSSDDDVVFNDNDSYGGLVNYEAVSHAHIMCPVPNIRDADHFVVDVLVEDQHNADTVECKMYAREHHPDYVAWYAGPGAASAGTGRVELELFAFTGHDAIAWFTCVVPDADSGRPGKYSNILGYAVNEWE